MGLFSPCNVPSELGKKCIQKKEWSSNTVLSGVYCSTYNAIFARGSPIFMGYYFKMLQAGHLALKIRHEGLKIEAPGTQNGSTGPPTSHKKNALLSMMAGHSLLLTLENGWV